MATFAAPNSLLNTTLVDAQNFLKLCTAQGKTGGAIFCNPVQATLGENAGGMIPLANFGEAGVPTSGPLYLAVQFDGKGDYYNIGLCLFYMAYGVPFAQLFQ